ncbi:MAG: DUF4080 domain-containing protein, partial [Clostridia bacterium]|nr:DUF4080 domain-containing protein [Clostridia bacterium]
KFVDRTFNANTQRADEILKFIKDNYAKGIPQGVCFHFEIAGDILKESTMELLALMPRGLVQLEIGMQSFNEQTLEAINRKTDTGKLINNIKRLVGFGNMHIHIDLIAGLTGEDILSFERSFNIGYSLKSNMLQMGFLKLLYGADMRESPEKYPCEFMDEPPYEVISTPWLDAREIKMLKKCEDALERLFNSGRFLFTLDYLINEVGFTPFRLFNEFGNAVSGEKMSLKTYTKLIYDYFKPFCDAKLLRDKLVSDLLVSGSVDYIPDELKRYDPLYKKAKGCFKNSEIALLYSTEQVIAVQRNGEKDFFGRYEYKITDFSQCDTVGMEC